MSQIQKPKILIIEHCEDGHMRISGIDQWSVDDLKQAIKALLNCHDYKGATSHEPNRETKP